MRIENDVKLDYSDVLLRPKRSTLSSRSDVSINRTFRFYHGSSWHGIPIAAANMDTTGTLEMASELTKSNMLTCLSKYVNSEVLLSESYDPESYAVSFGMTTKDREDLDLPSVRVAGLVRNTKRYQSVVNCKFICLDVANGYMESFVDFVKEVRERWPYKVIIAGNVVTQEMTEALILAGADIVKVGIGPGSVCTTRKIAGVGYPQLSAVAECADAAHGIGGHIMADGGCVVPGDVSKAFCAGADFVMLGGMLAGHDECLGDIITDDNGNQYKEFYGMSSETAMLKHNGEVAEYRASEGKTVRVPYRGPVRYTVQEILGGVRSACTYIGADKIKDMPKRATFVRVNNQLNGVFS